MGPHPKANGSGRGATQSRGRRPSWVAGGRGGVWGGGGGGGRGRGRLDDPQVLRGTGGGGAEGMHSTSSVVSVAVSLQPSASSDEAPPFARGPTSGARADSSNALTAAAARAHRREGARAAGAAAPDRSRTHAGRRTTRRWAAAGPHTHVPPAYERDVGPTQHVSGRMGARALLERGAGAGGGGGGGVKRSVGCAVDVPRHRHFRPLFSGEFSIAVSGPPPHDHRRATPLSTLHM